MKHPSKAPPPLDHNELFRVESSLRPTNSRISCQMSGMRLAEARMASAGRAQPDDGAVVAGERAGGVGVANRVTVAGVGVATEPVDMARAGVATGMASDRVVVMARAAAGDARLHSCTICTFGLPRIVPSTRKKMEANRSLPQARWPTHNKLHAFY
mgnify:CR=1 FL=1